MDARLEQLESRRLLAGNGATTVNIGSTRFFVGTDAPHGAELWKSDLDGSNATLVRDIWPGSGGSTPSQMINFNGTLFFAASFTLQKSLELWKSDGTPNGTVLVKDIYFGGSGSSPHDMRIIQNHLVFQATRSGITPEFWTTDGTDAGTVRLLQDEPQPRIASNIVVKNDLLYFETSSNTRHQNERWQSDGTPAGTIRAPGPMLDSAGNLIVFGTDGDDTIHLSSASGRIAVALGANTEDFALNAVHSIRIESLLGNDSITIDGNITIGSTINGCAGNDTILGGSGDDLILGGDGDDDLHGGSANDTLQGNIGADTLSGDAGRDSLAADGTDLLRGDPLDSGVDVVKSILIVIGTSGNNNILVEPDGENIKVVVDGEDTFYSQDRFHSIRVDGAGGNDIIKIQGLSLPATLNGGAGDDVIYGANGADRINGGDGNDWLSGGANNDTLYGDAGNDRIFGGDGKDYIVAGAGNDVIRGGTGRDRIFASGSIDNFRSNKGDLITLVAT
jgi:ELWxxDGT repeat protein